MGPNRFLIDKIRFRHLPTIEVNTKNKLEGIKDEAPGHSHSWS